MSDRQTTPRRRGTDQIEGQSQCMSTQSIATGSIRNRQADEDTIGSTQEREFAQAEEQSIEAREMGDVYNESEEFIIPERVQQGAGDEPQVLEPTNPLMVKFQNSLKDLLLRQEAKLQEEIITLTNEIKIQERDREELGERLYNLQEDISQIHCHTESCNNVISDLCVSRNKMESELQCAKQMQKQKCEELEAAKQLENKLRADLLATTNMLSQLKACEDEMESELAVSQCITDKTKKQKKEMCEAKKKQDWLLMRLRRAVVSLARERDELLARTEAKSNDIEQLNCSLADASTDLQILQAEQFRMTQSWNRIVVSIQKRDVVYNNVNGELSKAKDSFYLLLAEIEKTHKSSKAEMLTNEKLVGIHNRIEKDYNDLCATHRKNQSKMQDFEVQFITATKMLSASEQDLICRQLEKKDLQTRMSVIMKELEKVSQQKASIETKILDVLQDQGRQDRAFQNLKQKLISMKDNTKRQELAYVITENQISKYLVTIEEMRGTQDQSKREYDKLVAEEECICKELQAMDVELQKRNNEASRKGYTVHKLRQKLEDLKAASGIKEDEYPEEAKIKTVESEMEEVLRQIEEKETFWMRLQANMVKLASERQEQLRQLDLQYKQSQILKQRNLKVEGEIDKIDEEHKTSRRELENIYTQLNKKAASLYVNKESFESMSSSTARLMNEMLTQLKDAERRNLELEEELTDMIHSNSQLFVEANERKRESMNWEKKIQMAMEAKQQAKEILTTGEMNAMKMEIHRMKIRLSQLRKIQEALIKDLDQCIARRETISYVAEAREKRSNASQVVTSSRVVHERKVAHFMNKTREAEQEIKSIHNFLESKLPETESMLQKQVQEVCARLKEVEGCVCEIERQIEEGQILKQQNLEEIVRRQKKAKMYSKVKEGKYCLQFRTDSRLQQEYCRQRNLNHNLQEVVDLLMQDFPQYHPYLRRICCTLQITR